MDDVKHVFTLEKGEPFYIENEEYYKIKLVGKDQDEKISFSHPYVFSYRIDNAGENLYIAGESSGKISRYSLQFYNNRNYSLKDFQNKMKSEELLNHFINVKVIEHDGEYRFALYGKIVNSNTDKEGFITILPSSSLFSDRNIDVSEYKSEKLLLTLKDSNVDDYGKKYLPIIIKESDKSEICELHSYSLFFRKDGTPCAFEPKTDNNDNGYYWWNKYDYGGFRYVALIDNKDGNYRLQLSDADGAELKHESTPGYNKFLNIAFRELNSSFLNQLDSLASFLSDNQIQALVSHLTNRQLKTLAQELNPEKLQVIIPILNKDQLEALVRDLNPEQVKEILPHLKVDQFKVFINNIDDYQLVELVKDLDEHHLVILSKELWRDRLLTLVHTLEGDKLNDLVNKLDHEKLAIVAQDLTDSVRACLQTE